MPDYEPLDLARICNAGLDVLGKQADAPIGAQVFHGLPFLVGNQAVNSQHCFLARGDHFGREPAIVPVGRAARQVIIAHRLVESDLAKGGLPGKLVANYVFHFGDGSAVSVPIRERFEIAIVPESIWVLPVLPFRAISDDKARLYPRERGAWDEVGRRQEEILRTPPRAYYLWAWTNPHPEQAIRALEIVPQGPKFIIAAVTLGYVDEHPFLRTGRRELKIVLPQPEDTAKSFNIDVQVDRGLATYPYALPSESQEEFLGDAMKGWGEAQNSRSSPVYVEVAATPSATLTVKQGKEVLGRVNWGEIESKGAVEPTPRLRIELIDRGRNWVHTTVVDDDSSKPVPCRVHFRSPEGVPYQPHGHHNYVNSNHDTWNVDVGGDVRLGQITYGYIDGNCQGWLPRGDVLVDVARGFEYEPLREQVRIEPGQRELTVRLKRWRDMNAEGWFSGDTHVHFLSTQGSHTEARGEDLNVVNLLQSQWGHLFTSTEEFSGQASVSSDGRTIVYVSQENRQHFLGHLILLGLKKHIMPWCSDGPGEAELAGTLEVMLSDWADQCHAQEGTVIAPHFPVPNAEIAALIATGRVDGVEMHRQSEFRHLEYYRYLNGGYRLPLAGGTDKMSSDIPIGLYRTYVRIPRDQEFTYPNWCRNLALGRTFMTSGPLVDFSVEGKEIGDTVMLRGNGGTVEIEARAESIFPIHTLEIVEKGKVVASTRESKSARQLSLKAKIKVEGHSWLAARVGGPSYFQPALHHDGSRRAIFAHTSPIYVAFGGEWQLFDQETAQYMLTLIEGSLAYVRETALHYPPGTVTHHHGEDDHLAYLARPLLQARDAVNRKLRQFAK
jgi:hypothetical protein